MSAILGLGIAGAYDAQRLRACVEAGFEPRALFGSSAALAREAGCPHAGACASFEDLLARADVDVVALAAPHERQAAQALAAGKHVLCERPGALSAEDCAALVRAAHRHGRTAAFACARLRAGGFTSLARQYLEAGRLGALYRVEAVVHGRPQGLDPAPDASGLFEDFGYELLDQVLDLLGWPRVRTLCAHQAPEPPGRPRHLSLFARAGRGIALSFEFASGGLLRPRHSINFLGDRGGLLIDHAEGGRGFSFFEEAPGRRAKLLETKAVFKLEPCGSILEAFREHLAEGRPHPGTTPEQMLELARWRERAAEALQSDREVLCV
ncbi:MAG: Gfo/Idh/MocA family oxidoreductase [Planctomycetota bacterium]|nr:Gfo/Idh/MocA family oxidoreductase [Planctomycetota bacterium]